MDQSWGYRAGFHGISNNDFFLWWHRLYCFYNFFSSYSWVTEISLMHWGWVMHIYISRLTSIGSDNGLLPGRSQAIIWTNAGILLIEHFRTNFSEIFIKMYAFSSRKMHLKMSFGKRWPFCLGLNVLIHWVLVTPYVIAVLVNIGAGLLPDGTKPLPEPMTNHHKFPVIPQPSITKTCLKISYLKFN